MTKPSPLPLRRIEHWEDGEIVVIDENGNFVGRFYSMPEARICANAPRLLASNAEMNQEAERRNAEVNALITQLNETLAHVRREKNDILASNAELREALKQIEERTRLTRDKELNDIARAALAKSDELKGGA